MAFLFRRRSLLLKVLLLFPTAWFLLVVFIGFTERSPPAGSKPVAAPQQDGGANIEKREAAVGREPLARPFVHNQVAPNHLPEDQIVNIEDSKVVGEKERPEENKGVLVAPKDPEGPGELGKPVILPKDLSPEQKKTVDVGWEKNAFNQYVSDLVSVHRSLPEVRDLECRKPGRYLPVSDMPDTSVIICFHNEAWSVLLRTVHSVFSRSPPELIHEIILVDDNSDFAHLGQQLEDYMKQYPKVKIIRAKERVGLIKARLQGAAHATGSVLTYLDSHCECTEGWLEPLLDRIARNQTTVVCPVIDVIDDNTLEYHFRDASGVNIGGFDWNLQFNWHAVPERQRRTRQPADPVESPTMAGGLFSIDRQYFEYLGTYDNGFDIWGGENLELSFKTWMCGGRLEIVPCSHVGHIFRKRSPYKWRTGVNVLKRNSVRLAEVWLDDYKKYYFQRIGSDLGNYGDVSARKQLRERLKCNSFEWYLKNIYPELFIPGEAVASGEVRNMDKIGTVQCLDSPADKKSLHKPVGLYPCHNQGGNQYWMLSREGEIRRDEACLDFAGKDIILYPCHGSKGNQLWFYDEKAHIIKHVNSNKCMGLSTDHKSLEMSACQSSNLRQQWKFQNYNASKVIHT